jgi:hypothetical protein
MTNEEVIARTHRWIARVVVGLNLCPFARRVFEGSGIRYAVSDATDEDTLLRGLATELQALASAEVGVETTLLIHPNVLNDFLDFNDFLDRAERTLIEMNLEGVIQLASFHPHYQFAETQPDDVENYTNRSPYPMLHLLREASISAVADDPDELLEIPDRNIATLRSLGRARIESLLKSISTEVQT